jgi:hypothetical protein
MLGVAIHDRFMSLGWLAASEAAKNAYDLTSRGAKALETFGIDLESTRKLRRRFACPCLDWTERRPHVGGALGAALLGIAMRRKWVLQDLGSHQDWTARNVDLVWTSGSGSVCSTFA